MATPTIQTIALDEWRLYLDDAHGESLPSGVRAACAAGLPIRAPGNVVSALVEAELVADPRLAQNELAAQWIGRCTWRWSRELSVPADWDGRQIALELDGVDTIATILVAGTVVAETATMHAPVAIDLTALAIAGDTVQLDVRFAPVLSWMEEQRQRLGDRPFVEWNDDGPNHPFNFARKMACNFGWDWGPTVITAGLWQPARLVGWSHARMVGVRPRTVATQVHDEATETWKEAILLRCDADLVYASEHDSAGIYWTLFDPEGVEVAYAIGDRTALMIEDPALWWPRGYGDQPRYQLLVELRSGEELLESWRRNIGIRTVDLDQSPDDAGTAFTIRVNGCPILCKGANWIPDDLFVERVDQDRYRRRIQAAIDGNHNMLRIWGGGIFERDELYELCDELGVMVWQDFLFACSMVPEEPPYDELVEAEARSAVTRLSRFASLVLYCGCNENFWAYQDWGWPKWCDALEGRSWGESFYLGLLPDLVRELDGSRPYVPGSPYSMPGVDPQADGHGPRHVWDAWNDADYDVHANYRPRFVAEFGHQGPANRATLRNGIGHEPALGSAELLHRQKAIQGVRKMSDRLAEHFPAADSNASYPRWHYLAQVNQARALRAAIGHYRSLWPHCAGILYWQLNDCWPAISWSTVDFEERLKPAWYAVRDAFAPVVLWLHTDSTGALIGALHVDRPEGLDGGDLVAQRLKLSGERGATASVSVPPAPPREVTRVTLPWTIDELDSNEVVLVSGALGGAPIRAHYFAAPDLEQTWPEAELEVDVSRGERAINIAIVAKSWVRDLVVMVDELSDGSHASDLPRGADRPARSRHLRPETQLLLLAPGEETSVRIPCDRPEEIAGDLVLWAANRPVPWRVNLKKTL